MEKNDKVYWDYAVLVDQNTGLHVAEGESIYQSGPLSLQVKKLITYIVASDQGLHSLLTGISMQNTENVKIFTRNP